MKRITNILLAAALVVVTLCASATGCKGKDKDSSSSGGETPAKGGKIVELNLPKEQKKREIPSMDQDGALQMFFKAKEEMPDEITVLSAVDVNAYEESLKNQVFISPNGNDAKKGGKDTPKKTLQAALDKLRNAGGGVVWLLGGTYQAEQLTTLDSSYSGKEDSPLFISAYEGQEVTVTSAVTVERSDFKKVSEAGISAEISSRLSSSAKKNALVVNLTDLGYDKEAIKTIGDNVSRSVATADGKTQTIARYPNAGASQIPITEVIDQGRITDAKAGEWYEKNKDKTTSFVLRCNDDAPYGWKSEDIWMCGQFNEQWDIRHYPVYFNEKDKSVHSKQVFGNVTEYVINTGEQNMYYLYNALEALDAPGEWYYDEQSGNLFYYPDGNFSVFSVSGGAEGIISMKKTKNVVINGIDFQGAAGITLNFYDCDTVVVQNCKFTNNGANSVKAYHCRNTGVIYSEFIDNLAVSVDFSTKKVSDNEVDDPRVTLKPEYNFVQNCTFKGAGPSSHITLNAYMSVVSHNYLEDAKLHLAGPLECVIEYNEIVHGTLGVEDSGFIYSAGSGNVYFPYMGCNHIRYNYLHDFVGNASHAGVYLDDRDNFEFIYGNVADVKTKETGDIFGGKTTYRHHNGICNVFFNNISIGATRSAFYDCEYLDAKLFDWDGYCATRLQAGKKYYDSKVFADRYPLFAEHYEKIAALLKTSDVYAGEGKKLAYPYKNYYMNNISVDTPLAFRLGDHGEKLSVEKDNLTVKKYSDVFDEGYVLNINAYSKIANWEYDWTDVPFEKAGLSK